MSDATHIFLHLLKTGGTALRLYIDNAFPEESRISHLGDEKEISQQLTRLSQMSAEERQRVKVVFGHFAGKVRQFFPQAMNFTVIREPFARLVSQYVYERHNAEALGIDPKARPLAGEVSLPELCESVLRMGLKGRGGNFNLQARTIADYLGEDPESVREKDLPGFIEKFDLIGLQEHFALFIFLLHGYHQYPLRPVPLVYSYSRNVREYFPQWLVEECRKYGHIDFRLYELVKAKFDNDVNRLFGASAELAANWEEYRRDTSDMLEQQIVAKHSRAGNKSQSESAGPRRPGVSAVARQGGDNERHAAEESYKVIDRERAGGGARSRVPSNDAPLIFHHLIKTGGSSINRWLVKCFEDERWRVDMADTSKETVEKKCSYLEGLTDDARSEIKVVYGHRAHAVVRFFPRAYHMVLMRDPVSYAVSRYVFDRAIKETSGEAPGAGRKTILHGEAPLDEVLERMLDWGHGPSYNTCRTHMVAAANAISSSFPKASAVGVADVPELLDCFDFVGVTDQIPLICFLLAEKFDLPTVPVERTNATHSGKLYLPLWFREEVEKRARIDKALYDEACRRLDRLAGDLFNSEPAAYRRFQRYQEACAKS